MSDCCDLSLRLREDDVERFCAVTKVRQPYEFYPLPDGTFEIEASAHYAWYLVLRKAAEAGITFVGSHDAGCTYNSGAFVGVDGKYHERETSDGSVFVAVNQDTGKVSAYDHKQLKRYLAAVKKAERVIARKGPVKPAKRGKDNVQADFCGRSAAE